MRRRTYLTAIGVMTGTALAGCSGGSGGNNSSGGDDNASNGGNATGGTPTSGSSSTATETETETETAPGTESTAASTGMGATNGTGTPTAMREPSPTAMATSTTAPTTTAASAETSMPTTGSMASMPTAGSMTTMGSMSGGGNADVSIDSSEFSKQTDTGITNTAMVGTLTAPSYLSSIELQAQFYNDNGDILTTGSAYFQGLEKGKTWNFYVPSLASQTPADGEVKVASATMGSPPSDPGAKLIESSLNEPADEFSGPTVTGRAKNTSGSALPYLEARIHFLTDDGTALESDFTNITDLPAGETWHFKLEAITFSTDPRPDIADFDVTLASGL